MLSFSKQNKKKKAGGGHVETVNEFTSLTDAGGIRDRGSRSSLRFSGTQASPTSTVSPRTPSDRSPLRVGVISLLYY